MTQEQQVIEMMRSLGGYSTFRQLNAKMDFSTWKTKTPQASVRRIVQDSKHIFRIQPGLWALEECRADVLKKFKLEIGNKESEDIFTHGYFQGLLVEIGKMENQVTYIPAQDQNRLFIDQQLKNIVDTTNLPAFTYDNILSSARQVDVIWFNKERFLPSRLFEVEHTTNMTGALDRFYELQDFAARFFIVADAYRKSEFESKVSKSIYKPIKERVAFLEYAQIIKKYEGLTRVNASSW
jgi:hypothetical protein